MKKLLGAMALMALIVSGLGSQPILRIMTYPKVPTRDVLDRLDLSLAWKTRLPTGGQRDGLFTLQLLPAKNRTQLVVQTISGTVFMLDAETGDPLWRTTVGIPGWSGEPVGYNEQNLFVIRRDVVHILNRTTGAQRYYTVNKDTKLRDYGFTLPAAPSAAPRADDSFTFADLGGIKGYMIFFCMGNRVEAYLIPELEADEATKATILKELSPQESQAILEKTEALPPMLRWSHQLSGTNVVQPVLITPDKVTAVTTGGNVLTFNKFERSQPFDFQANGNVSVPMGQHGIMAYIGSEDYTLYALNMASQGLAWRFLASAPILVKPVVTDRDVFVTGHRKGLYRVERDTGRPVWLNKQADRFLSTNQKFVYALDPSGLLLVLDYARGSTMAQYDMRDWLMPVSNELTDRFYLAANDGQILCLRNRKEKAPLKNKTLEIKLLPKKEEKKEEKKIENKVMEKEMDNEKVKDKDNEKVKDKDQIKDKDEDKDKIKDKDKEKDKEKDKDARFFDEEKTRAQICCSWPRWEIYFPREIEMAAAWERRTWMQP